MLNLAKKFIVMNLLYNTKSYSTWHCTCFNMVHQPWVAPIKSMTAGNEFQRWTAKTCQLCLNLSSVWKLRTWINELQGLRHEDGLTDDERNSGQKFCKFPHPSPARKQQTNPIIAALRWWSKGWKVEEQVCSIRVCKLSRHCKWPGAATEHKIFPCFNVKICTLNTCKKRMNISDYINSGGRCLLRT